MLQVPNHVRLFFLQPRWGVCQVRQSRRVLSCVRATDVLAILMRSLPRVDQVVTELVGRVRGGRALGWLLSHIVWSTVVHDRVSDKVRETCIELVYKAFRGAHEHRGGRLTRACDFASKGDVQEVMAGMRSLVEGYWEFIRSSATKHERWACRVLPRRLRFGGWKLCCHRTTVESIFHERAAKVGCALLSQSLHLTQSSVRT